MRCFLSVLAACMLCACGKVPPPGQGKPQSYKEANFVFTEVGFGATARGFFADRIVVWGRVRNGGNMFVENPFVMTFQLLGQRGNVIDSGSKSFNALRPGASARFNIICEKDYPRKNVLTVADLPPDEQAIYSSLTDTLSYGEVDVPLDQVVAWTAFYTE